MKGAIWLKSELHQVHTKKMLYQKHKRPLLPIANLNLELLGSSFIPNILPYIFLPLSSAASEAHAVLAKLTSPQDMLVMCIAKGWCG